MSEQKFTPQDALELARTKHAGQTDKAGVDYVEHIKSVGDALADFDDDIRIAGYLHDAVEDTETTLEELRERGLSDRAVGIIERLSKNLHHHADYLDGIRYIAADRDAALVKIADNAHNSVQERVQKLLALGPVDNPPYAEARRILYPAVATEDIRRILQRVNVELLAELPR
jgi:(p)ppGpp synthase/HD superfamily hydrolase